MQKSCDRNDNKTPAKVDDSGVGTSTFDTLVVFAANTDKTAEELCVANTLPGFVRHVPRCVQHSPGCVVEARAPASRESCCPGPWKVSDNTTMALHIPTVGSYRVSTNGVFTNIYIYICIDIYIYI